jgi:hypothetical protein
MFKQQCRELFPSQWCTAAPSSVVPWETSVSHPSHELGCGSFNHNWAQMTTVLANSLATPHGHPVELYTGETMNGCCLKLPTSGEIVVWWQLFRGHVRECLCWNRLVWESTEGTLFLNGSGVESFLHHIYNFSVSLGRFPNEDIDLQK